MIRKENCLDHAVIENFFGLLKSVLFCLLKLEPMERLKTSIWIAAITNESRQSERACRLLRTDDKPFCSLKNFNAKYCVTFWNAV